MAKDKVDIMDKSGFLLGITGFASLIKGGTFFTRLFFSDFMRPPRGVVLCVVSLSIDQFNIQAHELGYCFNLSREA